MPTGGVIGRPRGRTILVMGVFIGFWLTTEADPGVVGTKELGVVGKWLYILPNFRWAEGVPGVEGAKDENPGSDAFRRYGVPSDDSVLKGG